MTVETARGPIDGAALGRVLMHEHVFVVTPDQRHIPNDWGDEETRLDDAATRLQELKDSGIDSILDPTVLGIGRDIARIATVAERTALNIVVATGLYTFDEVPTPWAGGGPGTASSGDDPLVDRFVRDITGGIDGTTVKAAVIKCATDRPGMTPGVDRVLRACARAHRMTGAPITTHTNASMRRGLEQQEVFRSEGVDLARVVIGHCGDTEDIGYLLELIDNGSILGMDRFGIDVLLPTDRRVAVIAELCSRGYADRMVLSHDAGCYLGWLPGGMPPPDWPNWHYLHIGKDVLPALRAAGVTEEQIDTMLIAAPRHLLEDATAY